MIRFAVFALLFLGASVCSTGAPEEWHSVYASEAWYQERPEPEREWHGTLRLRTVVEGPNARTALRYELATSDGATAVYAPTAALDRFANAEVTLRGKLVQVDDAAELWVAAALTRSR
jgi:hypothetical protein